MSDDGADPRRVNAVDEPDMQLLAWAVVNCHTLARRELNRLRPYVKPDTLAIERWEHVLRICEKAGARSKGVLRASLPTEITDGSESQNDIGFRDLIADGGLPEARRIAPVDPLPDQHPPWMEQDWTCPHCGQKIGTFTPTPAAAANPAPPQYVLPPTTAAQPAAPPLGLKTIIWNK